MATDTEKLVEMCRTVVPFWVDPPLSLIIG
jgi:hypothetical protein